MKHTACRRFATYFCIVALLGVFASCSKDDSAPQHPAVAYRSRIEGRWNWKHDLQINSGGHSSYTVFPDTSSPVSYLGDTTLLAWGDTLQYAAELITDSSTGTGSLLFYSINDGPTRNFSIEYFTAGDSMRMHLFEHTGHSYIYNENWAGHR